MCLGHADRVDLRDALRSENAYEAVSDLLDNAMDTKPERHSFEIIDRDAAPSVDRHMSVTGVRPY